MSRYVIFYDEVFKLHRPPYGAHLESPKRLRRALRGIRSTKLEPVLKLVCCDPGAYRDSDSYVLQVHDRSFVEKVKKLAGIGGGYIDPDTYVGGYTVEASYTYIRYSLNAVDMLFEKSVDAAVVLGRPPGHHAGKLGAAMGAPTLGFCVFNVSAIAAKYAEARVQEPILVLDFDLHHGNGTQEILYNDENIVHIDLHQDPSTIYPGTGWPWEYGSGPARGTKLNVVVPPDAGDDVYMSLFRDALDIALELMGHPRLIVVDAGFDGYIGDGLGLLRLTSNTYFSIGLEVRKLGAPTLVILEGGYSVGLERGLPAFLAGLSGQGNPVEEEPTESRSAVWREALENIRRLRAAIREARSPLA